MAYGNLDSGALDDVKFVAFMRDLQQCFGNDDLLIINKLPDLFDELRGCFRTIHPKSSAPDYLVPPALAMDEFLRELREPVETVDASGLLCDPWSAARLRRDELRNASTLRWFLDPRGHGCGSALMRDLLSRVGRTLPGFPDQLSSRCSVLVEECPDGEQANRVDIQIADPAFFLVIEVKINAGEQPGQIARYCQAAATRCAGKPFAVLFLTVDGRQPKTAGAWMAQVVPLSWVQLAASIRRASRDSRPIPRFLAETFAKHIANL